MARQCAALCVKNGGMISVEGGRSGENGGGVGVSELGETGWRWGDLIAGRE